VAVLVEEPEGALLGLVALARQILERLAARGLLPSAYNTTMLVLHKVGLGEATGGVLRGTVENLGLGANCGDVFSHLIQWNAVFFWT